jgi:hypothetical protein
MNVTRGNVECHAWQCGVEVGGHDVIEGAGHLAPLETPSTFRELLLKFLAAPGAG